MLSILIPVYNYDCTGLVQELHKQVTECGIDFEIICRDDHTTCNEQTNSNQLINTLSNCSYQTNPQQYGRAANRNNLACIAQYNWVLFLDCDMMPSQSNYIAQYIKHIKTSKHSIIYGGISYKASQCNATNTLRYVYGINREAIAIQKRISSPYQHSLTSNIAIEKKTFLSVLYNPKINGYGYEDLVLINDFRNKNISIHQIDNTSIHLQLETSELFLNKCKLAMQNLLFIEKIGVISTDHTKIQKAYTTLSQFYGLSLFLFITKMLQKRMIQNLKSTQPNLKILDIFKLSYYCQLKTN